ncbi:MAG: hypothetical protein WA160_03995 [Pseudobdellovibrio sp.]
MTDLCKIVDWVKTNGDEKVLSRMKMFALSDLMKDGIKLEAVVATTACSPECLASVRKAAETVTKQKCPF